MSQLEKLEHNMVRITMEVSPEDFNKAIARVYNKQKNQIAIPGFRKGKAPRKMIEKMYGEAFSTKMQPMILFPALMKKH